MQIVNVYWIFFFGPSLQNAKVHFVSKNFWTTNKPMEFNFNFKKGKTKLEIFKSKAPEKPPLSRLKDVRKNKKQKKKCAYFNSDFNFDFNFDLSSTLLNLNLIVIILLLY